MTNRQILRAAHRWFGEGRDAIVVEVAQALGSAPREPDARMLVSSDQVLGTVGGGHLEAKAIARARALLTAPRDRRMTPDERYPLGPALGQCCGGAVTLAYRTLDASALANWPRVEPLFKLQLYGAGHVGRALIRQLALFDVDVDWIDERESAFEAAIESRLYDEFDGEFDFDPLTGEARRSTDALAATIRRVCVDAVDAEVRVAVPGSFYLVMTHSHDLDLQISEAILRRNDFGWFGLIGSRTKRARFARRMAERGLPNSVIERMVCPIGVAGIDAKTPEMIAIAAAAQMLQVAAVGGGATTSG